MNWIEDTLSLLCRGAGDAEDESSGREVGLVELGARLEDGLVKASTLEDVRETLGAASLLLQLSALRGELRLVDLSQALEGLYVQEVSDLTVAVIGLGDAGHALLKVLAAENGTGEQ